MQGRFRAARTFVPDARPGALRLTQDQTLPRRRIKVRGGNLGAFLCWAVVFADIGTSIYYVPGMLYLAIVLPSVVPLVMTVTVVALVGLGVLNVLGIKESARTTAIFATVAAAGQLAVVVATAIYLGPSGILESFRAVTHGPALNLPLAITG